MRTKKKETTIKYKQKKTFPSLLIYILFHLNPSILLNILLPFEPTLFPKLQVYLADFPYLRYTISPEAFYLEDLMRLLVRNGLKIIFIFFHNTSFFMDQKQYTVIGKNKHAFYTNLFLLKWIVKK